ncbi:MAG: methyltransferase regulatory domain-containing protein, partial [Alphaproteobacteria bacterium]|nr:methyltransferase regulatory domain-containing protein [Alphaproteobacteria bacterium]
MNAKQAQAVESQTVLQDSYDEFPYESYVYSQTHPDRMHTVASLFGLTPPDIGKARILELGCAGGGNLIPLAITYPKAKLLGIDLSGEQIAEAEEARKAMKLKNIEFQQGDIARLGADIGKFDYIICHGVFSWVPENVRDKIFDLCRERLTPDGLALISYNTLPGWSAVKALRDMMLYHTKNFKDPAQQIHEAKSLLNFLHANMSDNNDAYRQIIDRERKILNTTNESYIFHEHLESENHQFYIHQFVEMAAQHKLCYVGDAELSSMYLGNFNEKVQETFGAISDIVRQEQYIDFLTNRRFRTSIITRVENFKKISRNINHARILDFYIAARFHHDPADPGTGGQKKFSLVNNKQSVFTANDDLSAKVFQALADAGCPVKIEDLALELAKKEKLDAEAVKAVFLKNGFTLVLKNFISLHTHSFEYEPQVSNKPKAYAWTHYLASTRKKMSCATNMKNENVTINPFTKTLLSFLDGKNDKDALLKKMMGAVKSGELKVHKEGKLLAEGPELEQIMR